MFAPTIPSTTTSSRTQQHRVRSIRPTRRVASRFLTASLFAMGAAAATTATASAAPAPPDVPTIEIDRSAVKHPEVRIPKAETKAPVTVTNPRPTLPDPGQLVDPDISRTGVLVPGRLPDGYEFPDDDADPPICDGCDQPAQELPGEEYVDEPDSPADGYDEAYPDDYPYECGEKELVACPDEPGRTDDGDTPGPATPEDPGTTTTIVELEGVDVEVEPVAEERKDGGALAFTGSNPMLPLAGAGLLGAGVVVAGLSAAARRSRLATDGVELSDDRSAEA